MQKTISNGILCCTGVICWCKAAGSIQESLVPRMFHSVALAHCIEELKATPVRVTCFLSSPAVWGLVRVLLPRFFVLLVRSRGPALRLGVCLLGFPAVVCAVIPVPPIASPCSRCIEELKVDGGLLPCAACCVVGLRW